MNWMICLKSWKTTIAGIIAGLVVVLPQIQNLLDSNPATVCNWNIVVAGAVAVIGGIAAKDGDKTGGTK